MKYIDEYRDRALTARLVNAIRKVTSKPLRLMEVCGGHTMAIHKYGIKTLLPPEIKLVSGPGCPVCVTETAFIDKAIAYSRNRQNIIVTFGDLIRVPGVSSSLMQERAQGADVRIVYSPLDALSIAEQNRDKKVIFLAIGFETTAPGTALTVIEALKKRISNFFILSSHKIMPPAMKALIDENVEIDGYLAPGHVSVITGAGIFDFIASDYRLPVVIAGFEPMDILQSIYMLIEQHNHGQPKVEIQYKRSVRKEGNKKAQDLVKEVFDLKDGWWRGLGVLPLSRLVIGEKYQNYDIEIVAPVTIADSPNQRGCLCGEVLKGITEPKQCKLFAKVCTPENPVGACMVSNEGACHACYKYELNK